MGNLARLPPHLLYFVPEEPYSSISAPPPLRGADENSFAHRSVVERLPRIVRRVLRENTFPESVREALQRLHGEIPATPLRPIIDDGAPDSEAWNATVEEVDGADWLEAPWFFVETYFYRRIVAATGYFTGPLVHEDPFDQQKTTGLRSNRTAIRAFARTTEDALRRRPVTPSSISALLSQSLWGNRADLSLWAADEDDRGELAQSDAHLLVDHRDTAGKILHASAPKSEILFVADNAGLELVGDLCLIDALLSGGIADAVRLDVKSHPTFVSDAVPDDVGRTIRFLRDSINRRTQKLGGRLQAHRDAGRLQVEDDFFWTSPLPLWRMPDRVRQRMKRADLVVLKGDAHYRRMLGDRHWPFDTPLDNATGYLPSPTLALRTLKSEVAVGLSEEAMARARADSADWAVNGEWGVVQCTSR